MKKTLSILTLFAAALALNAKNVIINGGFENMKRWGIALHNQDFASITQITDDVKEGKTALKFEFTKKPKVYICISQHVNLKPEYKAMDFSIKYKAPNGGGVIFFMFPKAGNKVVNLPPSKDWKEHKVKVDIPANMKAFRFELRLNKQGTMIIDDIQANAVSENKK